MTKELHSCVTYGLERWALAYASAARVRGPSLCQKGSVGTLLATGIWLSSGGGFAFDCASGFDDWPRLWP